MSKIVAFYEDISRPVIGIVVEETEQYYKLQSPVVIAVRSPQPGSFQTDFIPYEVVSIEPNILPLRALCEESYDGIMTFYKTNIKIDNLPLRKDLVDNYARRFDPSLVKAPETNIVKLF